MSLRTHSDTRPATVQTIRYMGSPKSVGVIRERVHLYIRIYIYIQCMYLYIYIYICNLRPNTKQPPHPANNKYSPNIYALSNMGVFAFRGWGVFISGERDIYIYIHICVHSYSRRPLLFLLLSLVLRLLLLPLLLGRKTKSLQAPKNPARKNLNGNVQKAGAANMDST